MGNKNKKKNKNKKAEPFYVNINGERQKVKPGGRKFDGTYGDVPLAQATVVNGELFPVGLYPFIFWGDVPIFDKKDNPIVDDDLRVGEQSDDLRVESLAGDVKEAAGEYSTYVPDSSLTTSPDRPDAFDSTPVHDSGTSPSPSYSSDSSSSSGGYDGSSSGSFGD